MTELYIILFIIFCIIYGLANFIIGVFTLITTFDSDSDLLDKYMSERYEIPREQRIIKARWKYILNKKRLVVYIFFPAVPILMLIFYSGCACGKGYSWGDKLT